MATTTPKIRKKVVFWHIPVTETLNQAVEEAVDRDMHSTKTELVREAVREKLQRMGVAPLESIKGGH